MRAWLIEEPGAPEALQLGELDTPKPGPQEVRVDIRAIGINRADLIQRKGGYPPPKGFDPRCPGLEYAGEVVEVGDRVIGRRVGDRVMGLIGGAAYAEQLVTHERDTLDIPAHYDYAQAAAIPEAFLTAYRALFLVGELAPGQWALVRGATSGVGQAGLQLIRPLGARSIATSRSQARLDDLDARLRALGLPLPHGLVPSRLRRAVRRLLGDGARAALRGQRRSPLLSRERILLGSYADRDRQRL